MLVIYLIYGWWVYCPWDTKTFKACGQPKQTSELYHEGF